MGGVADLIGNTPMVELHKLNRNNKVKIFAKLEGNNHGGSVKDRPAFNMIRAAIERGDIKPILNFEPPVNTGIAIALAANLWCGSRTGRPSSSTESRLPCRLMGQSDLARQH